MTYPVCGSVHRRRRVISLLSFPRCRFHCSLPFLAGPAAPAGAGGTTHRTMLAARPVVAGLTGTQGTSLVMTCPLLFWRWGLHPGAERPQGVVQCGKLEQCCTHVIAGYMNAAGCIAFPKQ